MYGLTKKEKLKIVLEKVKEIDVSAYDIAKNTNLTESGIIRILNGTVKNPHENSLNAILEYCERKVSLTNVGKTKEPEAIYEIDIDKFQNNKLIKCMYENSKFTLEIIRLQEILRKNKIEFKNIFEEEN